MEIFCSFKSYYKQNQRSKVIANRFLFCLVVVYLITSSLIVLGNYNVIVLGLDYLITGPLILFFIIMYAFFILENRFLGIISFVILTLNLTVSAFGITFGAVWMYSGSLPYVDLLMIIPYIFPVLFSLLSLFLFNRLNNKIENYQCEKTYEVSNGMVFSSILLPLLFLHFIGNYLRYLYVILT